MNEEAVDILQGHLGQESRRRSEELGPMAPVAALALSVVSLIGISPAQLLSQAVLYHGHDLRALAVGPGIGAVVAVISVWLGCLSLRAPAMTWHRSVGGAAIVVAVVALIINAAAFIGTITVSSPGGLISG